MHRWTLKLLRRWNIKVQTTENEWIFQVKSKKSLWGSHSSSRIIDISAARPPSAEMRLISVMCRNDTALPRLVMRWRLLHKLHIFHTSGSSSPPSPSSCLLHLANLPSLPAVFPEAVQGTCWRCFLGISLGRGAPILPAGIWCSMQRKEESHNNSRALLSSLSAFHCGVHIWEAKHVWVKEGDIPTVPRNAYWFYPTQSKWVHIKNPIWLHCWSLMTGWFLTMHSKGSESKE